MIRFDYRHAVLLGLVLPALALVSASACAAIELAGVAFPDRVSVGGATLEPSACGVRDTLWIDHYATVLYVPADAGPYAVSDPAQPAAVVMHMIETRYMPDRIPDKWLEALERAVPPRKLDPVRRAYRALGDGDRVRIDYSPAAGTTIRVDGRTVAALPGHGAIDAILRAWSEDSSVRDKLRELPQRHPCH
jgi:hypothetical protein